MASIKQPPKDRPRDVKEDGRAKDDQAGTKNTDRPRWRMPDDRSGEREEKWD